MSLHVYLHTFTHSHVEVEIIFISQKIKVVIADRREEGVSIADE